MKKYSPEVKAKVLKAASQGATLEQLHKDFGVGRSTISNWKASAKATMQPRPLAKAGPSKDRVNALVKEVVDRVYDVAREDLLKKLSTG